MSSEYRQEHYTASVKRMPFGRWKGVSVTDLPDDYLQWLVDEVDMQPWLDTAVRAEYAGRHGAQATTPAIYRLPVGASVEMALRLVQAGRRALSRELHPDVGGDHESMVTLNTSADWLTELVATVAEV
jgi:hypothetical protein